MAITRKNKGFTLIEMLVVVGIFAVVATVLLFNFSDFSTSVGVRNLAEEIGLNVRKAQSYATSVRNITGTAGIMSDTFPAYGVSFSVAPDGSRQFAPSSTNFPLFVDVSPDGTGTTNNLYENGDNCGNPGTGQECVESLRVVSGNKIVSLCTDVPSANTCLTPGTSGDNTVNIVFHRPNPDAFICVVSRSTGACRTQQASYLKVTIESLKGLQRVITIWNTGQISVN